MDLGYEKLSASSSFTATVTLIDDVVSQKYEGDEPLPQVMNLLESDLDSKNALHLAIENNFFVTVQKLLNSQHPALGLALVKADSRTYRTPLEALVANRNAYEHDLGIIKEMLEIMSSALFSTKFFPILEKIRTNQEHMENEQLMHLIFPYYQKVAPTSAAVPYMPAFQSQSTARRDAGDSVTSSKASSLSAPTFFKFDHKQ